MGWESIKCEKDICGALAPKWTVVGGGGSPVGGGAEPANQPAATGPAVGPLSRQRAVVPRPNEPEQPPPPAGSANPSVRPAGPRQARESERRGRGPDGDGRREGAGGKRSALSSWQAGRGRQEAASELQSSERTLSPPCGRSGADPPAPARRETFPGNLPAISELRANTRGGRKDESTRAFPGRK